MDNTPVFMPDETVDKSLYRDEVHLNIKGGAAFAKNIKKVLLPSLGISNTANTTDNTENFQDANLNKHKQRTHYRNDQYRDPYNQRRPLPPWKRAYPPRY